MLRNSIILILISFLSVVLAVYKTDDAYFEEFRKFVITFGKTYKTPKEESLRFEIWRNNRELIETHNARATLGKETYWMKMNAFGDLVISIDFFIFQIVFYLFFVLKRPSLSTTNLLMVTEVDLN
jgi:hypothetical protein